MLLDENSIILHDKKAKFNNIVLLLIHNNSLVNNIAKTCLPPSMLSSSSIGHV